MPNWVSCLLCVNAFDDAELQQIIERCTDTNASKEARYFSMEKIRPIPQDIKDWYDVRGVISAHERIEYLKDPEGHPDFKGYVSQAESDAMVQSLISKYDGATDERAWKNKYWGTYYVMSGDNWLGDHINFQSAWNPPIAGISYLSSLFPRSSFQISFYEPGAGFQGEGYYKGGEGDVEYWDYDHEEDEGGTL